MTPLYRLDAAAHSVGATFEAHAADDPWAGGYVAPARFAPVITAGREFVAGPRPIARTPRRMVPRLWGVPPPPSALHEKPVLTVSNPDSPFWIGNLRNAEFRCLVPATAFMVWGIRSSDRPGARSRHWFACADQMVFALAGVWKDSEVPSFALLTSEANAALRAAGRDTMPVILPADAEVQELWLRGGWDRARGLLAPYPSSLMHEKVF